MIFIKFAVGSIYIEYFIIRGVVSTYLFNLFSKFIDDEKK